MAPFDSDSIGESNGATGVPAGRVVVASLPSDGRAKVVGRASGPSGGQYGGTAPHPGAATTGTSRGSIPACIRRSIVVVAALIAAVGPVELYEKICLYICVTVLPKTYLLVAYKDLSEIFRNANIWR